MNFEWDENKAAENLAKHGVSFEEAAEAFFDPNAVERYDEAHSVEEERFIVIGLSSQRLLFVVFTERQGEVIRIISARKAAQEEEKEYGHH